MKLAVCQAPADLPPGGPAWQALAARAAAAEADLFLLNELPFGPWIAAGPQRIDRVFQASQQAHDDGLNLLGDLGARAVAGSRATTEPDGRAINEGFLWDDAPSLRPVHTKQFFPDEEGYYEARWFERGDRKFELTDVLGWKVGFLICTDVQFNEWARRYGRRGADIILVPRATEKATLWRWKTAVQMAAIVSGCYVMTSNRAGHDDRGREFGGAGWIFGPDGRQLAETSEKKPVVAIDADKSAADRAKQSYPLYVKELDE